MDNGTREERGWRPIQPWLARVDALKNASELAILLAELHVIGVRAAFSFYVESDARQPNMNIAVIDQGGMGLPSTEYYLSSAPNLQNLREAYKHHIRDSLSMVNISQSSAEQQSQLAFEMEYKLALISLSPQERRDAEKTYNKRTMRALKTNLTPNFEWTTYFHALNKAIKNETMREEVFDTAKDESQSVNVVVLKFMEGLQPLFAFAETTTLMEQWKAYLRWRIVDDTSTLLSERFQAKAFNFSKHLYGAHLQRSEQWKTCTKATQNSLGFLLGRYFVQRYFSPDSQELATELIHDLQAGAFRQSIDQLSWMDGRTKQKALQKLDAIMHKIGYPSEWPTYEELLVAPRRYFESAIDARRLDNAQVLRSAYKPVSKSEWVMHPQEVNAYYRPDWNEIVFPAGILQPPFFYSPSLSSSPPSFTNYGGIGMVIGHELTHGFDDQGRRYDASGNLTDWWTEATSQQFQQRASCVSQYYSQNFAIELLIKASSSGSEEGEETFVKSKLHVNGELTLGENIADIGGLKQAFLAWKTHNEDIKHKKQLEEEQYLTKQYFDGLDAAKLFFVSFAQNWCAVYSGEYLHTLVTTNPHSPNEFRVKGPVSHNKYFAEAFGCAANAPMNPKNKCDIW
ncbi:Neutral endopeptidase [Balamuthia mandrillaris]